MKFEATTPIKVAAGIAGVVAVLAVANYLAGVLLFLSYRQSPGHVGLFTILQAYLSVEDPAMHRRVTSLFLMSLLLCFAGAFGLWMTLRSGNSSKTLYGNARFATLKDIRNEKLDSPQGVVLGRFKDELLRLDGYEFVLLAAPTRTGKGVGFCVPNLLQFTGSAVVLDIKGENYNLTSEFRKRYLGSEIIYFNPFSAHTHRWNPLSYVSADPNFRANDLMALATIIYPVNEKDPFWSDAAKNLFIGLGLLVLETPELPPTLGEVLRQGSGKGMAPDQYLRKVLALRACGDRPLSNACRDSLNRFLSSGEQAVNGVQATFTASLTPWANAVIDKATSGDDFDLRDVRRKKMTIYLNIPAGEILQAAPIIKLFFSQLINENVKELPEHNPALKYQCLVLLDEFTAMGKVDIIAKGVGYMAGYNMRLAIVIQDKNQLEAVYGKEDAHNIVSNMGAVIYFTPTQIGEAEEYSKMIGNDTVSTTSRQSPKGQLFGVKGEGGGSSTTEQYQSRAILLPQELLQMSKDLELVVRPGMPVIQAGKIRYYEDEYFNERYTAVPMHEVNLGGQRRKVPIPAALPSGDWAPYQAAVAASEFYVKGLQSIPSMNATAPDTPKPPPSSPVPEFPPVQRTPPAASAPAAVIDATPTWPDWLQLPEGSMPYDTLHAILRRGAPMVHGVPPVRVANAYAQMMVAFWQAVAAKSGLSSDEPLLVLDLNPDRGEFAWKLIIALQTRQAVQGDGLPPVRYVACTDDQEQARRLERHPYLVDAVAGGTFAAMHRDMVLSHGEPLVKVNPAIVVAESLFSSLSHTVLAFEGGTPVTAEVTARQAFGADARVALSADWSPVDLDGLSKTARSLLEYVSALKVPSLRAPIIGSGVIEAVDRLCAKQYLLIAADHAISRGQDVQSGSQSLPAELAVPPPPLRANYHGLLHTACELGAETLIDAGGESVPDLMILLTPIADRRHMLKELCRDLLGIRQLSFVPGLNDGDGSVTWTRCLAVARQAEYDPHVLLTMYEQLSGLDWLHVELPLGAWHHVLEQAWRLCLPVSGGRSPHTALAYLAWQTGHLGLAREATHVGMAVAGPSSQDLHIEALCALQAGDHAAARKSLSLAEALAGGDTDATHRKIAMEVYRREQDMGAVSWFDADFACDGPVRLQPLALHHAAALWVQSRSIEMTQTQDSGFPALKAVEDLLAWIEALRADPRSLACVVLHEDWGEIGTVRLDVDADAGLLHFWLGAEHQGQGHGPRSARMLVAIARAAGVQHLFAAAGPTNHRALGALSRAGFVPFAKPVEAPARSAADAPSYFRFEDAVGTTDVDADQALSRLLVALSAAVRVD